MNQFYLDLNQIPTLGDEYALCIGTFDGVHQGHISLLKKALSLNKKVAILLIYSSKSLTKEHQKTGVLTSLEERVLLFKDHNVDTVMFLNLGSELLKLSAKAFIDDVLNPFHVSAIIVGDDFHFGYQALGNTTFLKHDSTKNFKVYALPALCFQAEKISTSLIKRYLAKGEVLIATKLLTRPYKVTGLVTKGFGLGNKIGYPTANISLDINYYYPSFGVYLVRVTLNNKKYYGMSSLGHHPTVNETSLPVLEVHIFDFKEDIYHMALTVEFLEYLRPEVKYETLEDLIMQLGKDAKTCQHLLKTKEY